jgi:beta-lactamase class A
MSRPYRLLVALLVVALASTVGMGVAAAASPRPTWLGAYFDGKTGADLGAEDMVLQHELMGQASADRTAAGRASTDEAARKRAEANLTALLTRYDSAGTVDLSVAVVNRRTGRTYTYAGSRSFQTASIVKVDILASLLLQAQHAGRGLTSAEKGLARSMIEASDNDAATSLWQRTGGIATGNSAFGLSHTRVVSSGAWGLTNTTARDQAKLITGLADPNGPVDNAEYELGLMSNVMSGQDWGISAAAQPGEQVALKNGWLPRPQQNNLWIVNSIGRISDADTDVAIAILSRGQPTLDSGVDMVEDIARQTRAYLGW